MIANIAFVRFMEISFYRLRKKPNANAASGFFGSQSRYFSFFRGNYWTR